MNPIAAVRMASLVYLWSVRVEVLNIGCQALFGRTVQILSICPLAALTCTLEIRMEVVKPILDRLLSKDQTPLLFPLYR